MSAVLIGDHFKSWSWKPISPEEFSALFEEQYSHLNSRERESFEVFRVPFAKAFIRRSSEAGLEKVFVVARCNGGVLYFDDVEYGFNISLVDENEAILKPGGNQATLQEAIAMWFPTTPS